MVPVEENHRGFFSALCAQFTVGAFDSRGLVEGVASETLEEVAQRRSEDRQTADQDNRDQPDEQGVFDCGGTGLLTAQTLLDVETESVEGSDELDHV